MNARIESENRHAVSRRGFLAGTGVMAAGGFVAGGMHASALADEGASAEDGLFANVKPAIGHIVHDPDLCAGCRVCEITCSLNKWGVVNSDYSCIRIHTDVLGGFLSQADICKQCDGPECVAACPTGALHIDEQTGARVIDRDVCIGCQTCLNACPAVLSNIHYNAELNQCVKCDLCGGDPQCVAYCPAHALSASWVEAEEDPNTYHTDSGITVNVELTGAIIVVAPDSVEVSGIDAVFDGAGVVVSGQVANNYTQPFTAKIKASYFDANGNELFFSERLEIDAAVGETISFEDVFETDAPEVVARCRLEIMCGKIAG